MKTFIWEESMKKVKILLLAIFSFLAISCGDGKSDSGGSTSSFTLKGSGS